MTAFETVRLVAMREITERLRSKTFLIGSAISLLVVLAAAVLPSLIASDGPKKYQVAAVGSSAGLPARMTAAAQRLGYDVEIETREAADGAAAERLVADGDADLAVVNGAAVVNKELNDRLANMLQVAHAEVESETALRGVGVQPDAARKALNPAPLVVRALNPPDRDADARDALMFAGTILLYAQLLGFGYWVASGILEEKASRVIEVVLAKAKTSHVLAGKIIGIGIIGFAQLIAFVTLGLVASSVSGSVELPPSTVRIAVEVVAWFVLGFAFYSCCFAVGGALASRAEEMQSTTGPISMVAVVALFVAMAVGEDPGGTVGRVATFIPPFAPLVMPIRSAAGELPLWEALVGGALVLLATYGAVRLAARVYAGSALNFRGQLKLRDALSRAR